MSAHPHLDILVKIRNVVRATTVGRYKISATLTYFDPVDRNTLPEFSITADPSVLDVSLFGTTGDWTFLIAMLGYTPALSDYVSELPVADDLEMRETVMLSAWAVTDAIIAQLTDPVNVAAFAQCGGTSGFTIDQIGPVYVDVFEGQSSLGFMNIPLQILFYEPE